MYSPAKFRVDNLVDKEKLFTLIEQVSFGSLISTMPTGETDIAYVPFYLDREQHRLLGHIAKANPLMGWLENAAVKVSFIGPNCYVSPSWYEVKEVPTWNYAVAQLAGKVRLINEPAAALSVLEKLSDFHEQNLPEPWAISDLERSRFEVLLQHIQCFEIAITELNGVFKLSQNRSETDQKNVRTELAGMKSESAQRVAALMAQDCEL